MYERILSRPERNVGQGDFAMRLVAAVILTGLVVVVAPPVGLQFPPIKISLLTAAEVGLIALMLGLFLDTKTHFAGLQLFGTSLIMFWLVHRQLPWVAVVLGLVVIVGGAASLITRRSRFNHVCNLSSIQEAIENTP